MLSTGRYFCWRQWSWAGVKTGYQNNNKQMVGVSPISRSKNVSKCISQDFSHRTRIKIMCSLTRTVDRSQFRNFFHLLFRNSIFALIGVIINLSKIFIHHNNWESDPQICMIVRTNWVSFYGWNSSTSKYLARLRDPLNTIGSCRQIGYQFHLLM